MDIIQQSMHEAFDAPNTCFSKNQAINEQSRKHLAQLPTNHQYDLETALGNQGLSAGSVNYSCPDQLPVERSFELVGDASLYFRQSHLLNS